ncbi:ATP-dependent DNA helicase RecG [Nocardioides yefusunii]|uniref:ATP-dependent DNA helicase RecG n=1 Tax=Nocardioides yefusunii TaxID=2500546 RepID=A0ABW1QXV4_9ACTN|nr:ATP-dependent DNA helicase RecG [Nocardioides yefusunii]
MTSITPESSIATVFGRQSKKRKAVEEGLGIRTVGDLLDLFPRRYVRTSELSPAVRPVEGELLSVVGEIQASQVKSFVNRRTGRRSYRLEVAVATQGPVFVMTYFLPYEGMANAEARRHTVGARGMFTGKVQVFNGRWQLAQPHSVVFGAPEAAGTLEGTDPDAPDADAAADLAISDERLAASLKGLMPIYPLTAGVYSWDLQKIVQLALELVVDLEDVLDAPLRERFSMVDVHTAYRFVHSPDDHAELARGRRRFRFVEALVLQLVLARRRAAHREVGGVARTGGGGLLAAFDARLPFTLTAGQVEVGATLEEEMARSWPMNRLLQGEVGSGKTLVALRAMLRAVDSGGQAVLLAPTEVLAQQHHRSITALLGDLAGGGFLGGAAEATQVTLLTGSMSKSRRREALLQIASGEAGIVIGTHALLEDVVSFADLALVVVDEQHRFGVEQRAALTSKAERPPHVLVMTATPIPRTVAMTVFGDLETSVLRELPAGRAPISTHVAPLTEQPHWAARVWGRVAEEVAAGHQVYVVCPRISGDVQEPGEQDFLPTDELGDPFDDDFTETAASQVQAAPKHAPAAVEEVVAELTAGPLAGLGVAALHGRMAADDKDSVMRRFAAGEIDVLVSTTVIEVGVDVANATTIVVLDADRFGISQLHQLRGRVGRGGLPGLCLLVTHAEIGSEARQRLDAVASTTDGFELSRVDLEHRREGDVLGRNQSGRRSSLENLRVLRDEETILEARRAAEELLGEDPALDAFPGLARKVAEIEASSSSDYMEKA